MNRNVRIERLYTLGDYKNIKIIDEIVGLPDSFVIDPGLAAKATLLLMAHVDLAFYAYSEMYKNHNSAGGMDKAMAYLSDLIEKTTAELNKTFSNIAELNTKVEEVKEGEPA